MKVWLGPESSGVSVGLLVTSHWRVEVGRDMMGYWNGREKVRVCNVSMVGHGERIYGPFKDHVTFWKAKLDL